VLQLRPQLPRCRFVDAMTSEERVDELIDGADRVDGLRKTIAERTAASRLTASPALVFA
jgi:hypothetical protein